MCFMNAYEYALHFKVCFAAVARWPGGQGGQLPPQLALKRGRQNDDRGAPAGKQTTRNVFNEDDYLCSIES